MTTKDTVAGDLLAVHQEAFAAALKQAEDRAQYVVEGRYVEQAVLAEVLEAARLAEQIRGKDPGATRHARIRLGDHLCRGHYCLAGFFCTGSSRCAPFANRVSAYIGQYRTWVCAARKRQLLIALAALR